MFISELFYSIQGEGLLSGIPSVFIRTSGCNLRCSWCDTPYTSWNPEGNHLSLDEITGFVAGHSTGHTVVTGGEPMIMPDIVALTRALRRLGQHITIETAGTVFEPVDCDLMSISPKLANSTPHHSVEWAARHQKLRFQPDVLRRLMAAFPYQLKFVVSSPDDMAEIEDIVRQLDAERGRVLLMPEGTDAAALAGKTAVLGEICKKTAFRLSPRLHIYLYGNQRGT